MIFSMMAMMDSDTGSKPLLVVCGPTASGKTALAVKLAKRRGGEIISADSMQVYRYMNIGTAKPTAEEMGGIPHHLLDFLEPEESFSVADWVALAKEKIDDIHSRGKLPIVAGGTGLYISSLVDNIQFFDMPTDVGLRQKWENFARKQGHEALWEKLRDCDPELAAQLHPNNKGRIIRGLEVFDLTGKKMSAWQVEARAVPSPYQTTQLGLTATDRQLLYNRIETRVEVMLAQGLEEEARRHRAQYSATAAQAIGYKELFPYWDGLCSREEAVEDIKRETRRYAKRQLTWLRRDERIHWLMIDQYQELSALADKAEEIAWKME